MLAISPGTSSYPKGNLKQCLCNFFGGVGGGGVEAVYYGIVQVENGLKIMVWEGISLQPFVLRKQGFMGYCYLKIFLGSNFKYS